MRNYSLREMRREYAWKLRQIKTILLSFFAAAVIFFWILYIRKGEHTPADVWFFAGRPVAVGAFVMGLYMVLTGEGWLRRHTPFGQALSRLGDARQIEKQIDLEAAGVLPYDSVFLLRSFLILYLPYKPGKGPAIMAARPYAADRIDRVAFSRAGKEALAMTVFALGEQEQVLLHAGEEARAVLEWINTQGIKTTWNN